MGRRPCTFKQADLIRAVKAARNTGLDLERAEIAKDGTIALVFKDDGKVLSERNEWDEIGGTD